MFPKDQNMLDLSQVIRSLLDQKRSDYESQDELWSEVKKTFKETYSGLDLWFTITNGIVKWRVLPVATTSGGSKEQQEQTAVGTPNIGDVKDPETVTKLQRDENPDLKAFADPLLNPMGPEDNPGLPSQASVCQKPKRRKKHVQPWTAITTSHGKKRKRPIPAYCYFFTEERKKVLSEMPDLPNTEISREIGARWRNLSADDKQFFYSQQEEGRSEFFASNLDVDDKKDQTTTTLKKRKKRQKKFFDDISHPSPEPIIQDRKKNPACETFSPDQMYRIDPHLKMKLFEKTPVKKIENGDEVETTVLSFEDNLAEMEQKLLMRDEVADFICTISGCEKYAENFILEEIDGMAFTELSRHDLMTMGLKLGPAIKVHMAITTLKRD